MIEHAPHCNYSPGFAEADGEPCVCGELERYNRRAAAANTSANSYPDGNPKTAEGAKKPALWLNPPTALIHLATAFMDGAKKYGPFNWRSKGVSASVYAGAANRHLAQWLDGENFDPVSRVHHLAHAMACLAILLDAEAVGKLNDDRPPPGASSELIFRWMEKGTLAK